VLCGAAAAHARACCTKRWQSDGRGCDAARPAKRSRTVPQARAGPAGDQREQTQGGDGAGDARAAAGAPGSAEALGGGGPAGQRGPDGLEGGAEGEAAREAAAGRAQRQPARGQARSVKCAPGARLRPQLPRMGRGCV